jgi:hypothetical protein
VGIADVGQSHRLPGPVGRPREQLLGSQGVLQRLTGALLVHAQSE